MTIKVSTKQLTQTVAPAAEPVTVAEMKAHLHVTGTDSDIIIGAQLTAARELVENHLQRALIQRTYRADLWCFATKIVLPRPLLASITNIKYYTPDSPQVLTTLGSTIFRANLAFNYVYLDSGATLPSIATRHDAVQITYVAGFAPSTDSPISDHAANVPEAIKSAIKLVVGDMFENRERSSQLRIQELPTVNNLLAAYREY